MSSKPSIFFIAGAPKTATSALWEYLTLHPEIFRPRIKEFHHFDSAFAAELLEYFRDDITELSVLTGRNLDHWLRKVW